MNQIQPCIFEQHALPFTVTLASSDLPICLACHFSNLATREFAQHEKRFFHASTSGLSRGGPPDFSRGELEFARFAGNEFHACRRERDDVDKLTPPSPADRARSVSSDGVARLLRRYCGPLMTS